MIRKFDSKDIDIIMSIWEEENIKAHNFISKAYWQNNFEYVKNVLPNAEIYVYEEENRIQGFIGLEHNYIAGIFVSSAFQSKGIGKQLLQYVKRMKNELTLNVYKKNVRAVQFYQRENFCIIRENIDESTNETEYEMVWKK